MTILVTRRSRSVAGALVLALMGTPIHATGQAWTCNGLPSPQAPSRGVPSLAMRHEVVTRIREGTAAELAPVALPGRVVRRSRLDTLWASDAQGVEATLAVIATNGSEFTERQAEIAAELFRRHRGTASVMVARLSVTDDAGRLRALRALQGLPLTPSDEFTVFSHACTALHILGALGPAFTVAREHSTGIGVLEELVYESWGMLGGPARDALTARIKSLQSPLLARLIAESDE